MTFLALGTIVLAAAAPALNTQQADHYLCQLVLQEEQFDRDDFDLNVLTTLSRKKAAGRIYALVDALWKKEAIERIIFLRAKHDRDVAVLEHDRALKELERQDTAMEQYRLFCQGSSRSGATGGSARRAAEEALDRYRLAGCEILELRRQRAAADLFFSEELLKSTRDLRANNVATAQDVILSERNVEMARSELEQTRARVERCRAEMRQAGGAD